MEFCLVCGILKRSEDVHGLVVCTVLFDAGAQYQVWQYDSIINQWAAVSAPMVKPKTKGDSVVRKERKPRIRIDEPGTEEPDCKAGGDSSPQERDRPSVDERGSAGGRKEGRKRKSGRARENFAEFLRLGIDAIKTAQDIEYGLMEGDKDE